MKDKNQLIKGILAAMAMLLLILDAKTAIDGAQDGITLCLYTVIPALFPFFVFSNIINRSFSGKGIRFLRPLGHCCGIPAGCESLLLLGFLGGYPVGAQAVYEAWRSGHLQKQDAHRLLGFCNNAGPSFLFGMVSFLFTKKTTVWILWGIHIISALIVSMLLPGKRSAASRMKPPKPITLVQSLNLSIRIMASVCGWVILFRIMLTICSRWFLWLFPLEAQITLAGLLELTNGCLALRSLSSEGLRFILCAGFLGSGGLCVLMQTLSVTKELGSGRYLPGKLLHCLLSTLLAGLLQNALFSAEQQYHISPPVFIGLLGICGIVIMILYRKNYSRNMIANAV